jgi:uncharacterized protein (TIGR00730 family)
MRSLCVFCGSSAGSREAYRSAARRLGDLLAAEGVGLVYGGGHVGLMGVLADAVLRGGGEVVGVIPQALVDRELAQQNLTRLEVVDTMHQRKARMADLADGFAALPGGFGTADELFEILTWAQLGLHAKPVALLNVAGFFDQLLAWVDRCVAEGFLRPENRDLFVTAADADELLRRLFHSKPVPHVPKWINPADR